MVFRTPRRSSLLQQGKGTNIYQDLWDAEPTQPMGLMSDSSPSTNCMVKYKRSHYRRGKISRVSQASPSAKNRALGEVNLPRVLHSGKNCTRGREAFPSATECLALGKEWHSAKALFPECNTRGRATLGEEKCYLTAQPTHAVRTLKNLP
jgi:hypothetical protein